MDYLILVESNGFSKKNFTISYLKNCIVQKDFSLLFPFFYHLCFSSGFASRSMLFFYEGQGKQESSTEKFNTQIL